MPVHVALLSTAVGLSGSPDCPGTTLRRHALGRFTERRPLRGRDPLRLVLLEVGDEEEVIEGDEGGVDVRQSVEEFVGVAHACGILR